MRNRIGRPRFMQSFTSAGGGPFLATPPSDGETYGVRNGEQWVEVCEEAPKNGTLYGRISNAWQPIPSGGDPGTASGVLFTPAGNISATNVQGAIQELDNEKVAKAGGANAIMTGFLTLHADPDAPLKAATKQYVDNLFNNAGVTVGDAAPSPNQGKLWWESDTGVLWMSYTDASSTQWISVGGTQAAISDASKADKTYVDAQDALKADKTYVDAQDALKADKTYVDTQDALSVLRDGTRTMTGDLTINKDGPNLYLDRTGTTNAQVQGRKNGLARWNLVLGDSTAEAGSESGSNFLLRAMSDAGGAIGIAMSAVRSTSAVSFPSTVASTSPTTGALVVAGGVGVGGAIRSDREVQAGTGLGGNSTGGAFGPTVLPDGQFTQIYVGLQPAANNTTGIIKFTKQATVSTLALQMFGDGSPGLVLSKGGDISIPTATASTSPTTGALTVAGGVGISGTLRAGGGAIVVSGSGAALIVDAVTATTPTINIRINGVQKFQMLVDSTNDIFVLRDADNSHGVQIAQNTTSWASYSDARMAHKQNARTVSGLLDRLDRFRLVEFGEDHQQIGVLAQELYQFAPQLVGRGDDDNRIIKRIDDGDVWTVKPSEAAFVALQIAKEIWEDVDRRLTQLETRV
jgi:hypothetical protein